MSAATHAPPRRRRQVLPPVAPAAPMAPATAGRTRRTATSLPFLGLVAVLLASGLIGLLMINNSLAAGSFEQAELRAEQTLLFEQEQALKQEVQRLSSPTRLRIAARDLGLTAAATTVYLDLTTGRILGVPKAAVGSASAIGSASGTVGESTTAPDPAVDPSVTDPSATDPTEPTAPAAGGDAAEPTPAPAGGGDPSRAGSGDGAALTEDSSAYDRAVISGEVGR